MRKALLVSKICFFECVRDAEGAKQSEIAGGGPRTEARRSPTFALSAKGTPPSLKSRLGNFVFFLELVYSTSCIQNFGFSGEVWVAVGANFHVDISDRSASLVNRPTSAANFGVSVFRMDVCFHVVSFSKTLLGVHATQESLVSLRLPHFLE